MCKGDIEMLSHQNLTDLIKQKHEEPKYIDINKIKGKRSSQHKVK